MARRVAARVGVGFSLLLGGLLAGAAAVQAQEQPSAAQTQAAPAPAAVPQVPAAVPQKSSGDFVKETWAAWDAKDKAAQSAGAADASKPADAEVQQKYVVPEGTKVLLSLRSAINTKSAKPGDGVYLVSTFPVVVGSHVLIPAGIYVQGVIDRVVRPGRVKGRAQVAMHFTSMIFPNGSVVEIPGVVNGLPGSDGPKVKDEEGTVEQASGKGHDVGEIAQTAATGASIGAIAGSVGGSPLSGAAYGGLGGAAVGTLVTLFSRGKDINIDQGTAIEMVLQRPLQLQPENLLGSDNPVQPGLAPIPGQHHSLPRPSRPRMLCPPGSLGCN